MRPRLLSARTATSGARGAFRGRRPGTGEFVVMLLILGFGFYILAPVVLIFLNSFNSAGVAEPKDYGLENWRIAFTTPGLLEALRNTFLVYILYTAIGFPTAVLIAWVLARTNIRYSYGLEFMFWMSFMLPQISTTIGWMFLLGAGSGFVNLAIERLPFVETSPFDIFSVTGIVWTHLMGNTISGVVMLLTPAFRNMDSSLEEAGRVSGASTLSTMTRVTLPVMLPSILVVFMLSLVRVFQSFEVEQLLGTPINFFVYSTKVFQFVRFFDPPQYGQATALASLTLLFIAVIIPVQRRVATRRQYTVVSGSFKPGLTDLGKWHPLVFGMILTLLILLTIVPVATLVLGSFMTRTGWFGINPTWTLGHWQAVTGDRFFIQALRNTFFLAISTALISPVIFSIVAYVIVRTRWRGRAVLDSLFWLSASVPGILSGLGLLWLFLGTSFLVPLYGTLYALVLVVILQGKLTSTQLLKGVYLQMGSDLEEAARVSGAGWVYTYLRVWLPLLMPTLVLIGTLNFVIAAGTTSSIVLLASRGTTTLSLFALQLASDTGGFEQAGIVSLFIVALTAGIGLIARWLGLPLGVRHR